MIKKYSNLLRKTKNGKGFSNFLYRFWKPFAVLATSILLVSVYTIHALTIKEYEYEEKYKYQVYIINVNYILDTYEQEVLKPLRKNYPRIEFKYFVYGNLNEEGQQIVDHFRIAETFAPNTSNSGRAILCNGDGYSYICNYITMGQIGIHLNMLKWR